MSRLFSFRKIFYNKIVGLVARLDLDQAPTAAKEPREAREEVVTVLFLDIIGFSAASSSRTPAEAFAELKAMFDRITRIVQRHGGTVDRTLGDGLLAYFSPHDVSAVAGNHADRALICGIAIHCSQIENTLAGNDGRLNSVLPFRIGINSGHVYMGDLGSDERSDFTIIGSVVNFGQRLEAACEINRIMIGEKTMEYSTQFSETTAGMRRRPIIAKNCHDPIDAFELDPFIGDREPMKRFISAYRTFARMARTEERLSCDGASLIMVTSHGHAVVANISRSGVMLRLEQYVARGTVIYISQVIAKVEHFDVPPLFVEVRWGSPDSDGAYLHGCLLKNLSDEQKSELWDLWMSVFGRMKESDPA